MTTNVHRWHNPERAYLDLLKYSICNLIYPDNEARIHYLQDCAEGTSTFSYDQLHDISSSTNSITREVAQRRTEGRLYKSVERAGFSHSMVGQKRIENLEYCMDTIEHESIAGDVIECGVWRGGSVIFLKAYLEIYNIANRSVWALDSFEGLPPSDMDDDHGIDLSAETYPSLAISQDVVEQNFKRYGLLDERVKFVKGFFETLDKSDPQLPDAVSLLRLDGDLHSSTTACLNLFYDKLSRGGFVIVDDYGVLEGCRDALDEFFKDRGGVPPLTKIDHSGVYFRKP